MAVFFNFNKKTKIIKKFESTNINMYYLAHIGTYHIDLSWITAIKLLKNNNKLQNNKAVTATSEY